MMVREWFRLQRAALWGRDPRFASDLDLIANLMVGHLQAPEMLRVGAFYWIESVESFEERERVLTLVRQDMEQAMRRLMAQGITD